MHVIQIASNYVKEIWSLMLDMSFWLLLGFFIAGMIYIYINEKFVTRFLKQNNISSVFNASLLGVPLPLCSCGVIPVGVSLYKNGVSKASTISFLISTPQTGVDSILVTYSLLGLPFAILRPLIAFFTGIMGGLISVFVNKKSTGNTDDSIELKEVESGTSKKNFIYGIKYGFGVLLSDISKYLIIGILIAGAIGILVPDDFFSSYIKNETLEMIIILIASVPIYVCATSSVPIAAMLLMKGLSPGAVLVFLMAGPATNAATINVISRVMGRKSLYVYLGTIIFFALFFGYLLNVIIPKEWFYKSITHIHSIHENHILPLWLRTISAIVLSGLLLKDLIKKFLSKKKELTQTSKFNNMANYKIIVKGMTCNHCKMTVEKNLLEIEGIEQVNADIKTGVVEIKGQKVDEQILKEKIEKAGYFFENFKN